MISLNMEDEMPLDMEMDTDKKEDTIFGLSRSDVKQISDEIFNRTDMNHPLRNNPRGGVIDMLRTGKPDISASSVFIKKVSL